MRMLPLTYVHLILVLFHIAAFARMWYVWKKNQLDRQMITENEKLVAKARLQVKEAMAKLNGGPSIPADAVPFHDDAPMLASILTAIVVKQGGDIRLSLSDMSLAEGNDYVSIYIDAEKQEMIFSTDHTKHLDMSLVNFSSSDDETYH